MSRQRHKLSKLELLEYALDGAVTERGLWSGNMTDEQEELLDNDIKEIERRIKLVKLAEQRDAALAERSKSAIAVQAAKKLGLPVIDVKLIPPETGRHLMNTTPLYIFDLDGTLADLKHRRHFVERPTFNLFDPKERKQANKPWKPNWDAFHAACVDDTPIKPVCDLLADLPPYCDVWVWSGRMETVRAQTIAWIQENTDIHTPDDILKMRPAGDFTPDDQLKESWLKAMSPEDRARLVMVFDDRDRVVNMWRRNGVVCAQVAPGDF